MPIQRSHSAKNGVVKTEMNSNSRETFQGNLEGETDGISQIPKLSDVIPQTFFKNNEKVF